MLKFNVLYYLIHAVDDFRALFDRTSKEQFFELRSKLAFFVNFVLFLPRLFLRLSHLFDKLGECLTFCHFLLRAMKFYFVGVERGLTSEAILAIGTFYLVRGENSENFIYSV